MVDVNQRRKARHVKYGFDRAIRRLKASEAVDDLKVIAPVKKFGKDKEQGIEKTQIKVVLISKDGLAAEANTYPSNFSPMNTHQKLCCIWQGNGEIFVFKRCPTRGRLIPPCATGNVLQLKHSLGECAQMERSRSWKSSRIREKRVACHLLPPGFVRAHMQKIA
jgi:hypothetical protein